MVITPHASRRQQGFTVIELLVVIAIIGTLAALLMPAIGSVRNLAWQTAFANNQRQVGFAIFAYADENQGRTPCRNVFIPAAPNNWWFQVLAADYLAMSRIDVGNTLAADQSIARSLFRDPADITKYPGWLRRCVNLAINGRVTVGGAGGVQYWGQFGWQNAPVSSGASNRVISTIAYPAELLLLCPGPRSANVLLGSEWGNSNTVASIPWTTSSSGPSEFVRYRGRAPITFADGHGGTITATALWDELLKDRITVNSRLIDRLATNP